MELREYQTAVFMKKYSTTYKEITLLYIHSQCKSKYLQSIDICQFPDMFRLKTKLQSRVESRGSQARMTHLPEQWWRYLFRCRIDLLNFSMGFNIIAPYMVCVTHKWIRCTLSYPNWVFVFMASVNYTSRCHQDAMALFWTVSYVMNSAEGTDGKQYHECPIVNKEGKILTTYTSPQTSTVKLVKPNLPTFHETTCIW